MHGHADRYDKLLASIIRDRPSAVFLGRNFSLPRLAFSAVQSRQADFVHDYLVPTFTRTRDALGVDYPDIFLILGNDDPRCEEEGFVTAAAEGLWHYIHGQKFLFGDYPIYGLAYVPPYSFLAEGLGALRRFPVRCSWLCFPRRKGTGACQPKRVRSNRTDPERPRFPRGRRSSRSFSISPPCASVRHAVRPARKRRWEDL